MRILCLASEVDPLAKTGGLADVTGALSKSLGAMGHDVRIVLPLYRAVARDRCGLRPMSIQLTVLEREVRVWEGALPPGHARVYCIDQPAWFNRDGLYQADGKDYPDNLERFSGLALAALALLPQLDWRPDIIHCHDWQAALACAHLAFGEAASQPFFASTAAVLTIHNLAYQGLFPPGQWALTGLPASAFQIDGLEFYGKINCLKGGLRSAAMLTTVSPTYAEKLVRDVMVGKQAPQQIAVASAGQRIGDRRGAQLPHHAGDVDALAAGIPREGVRPVQAAPHQAPQAHPFINGRIERYRCDHRVPVPGSPPEAECLAPEVSARS